MIPDQVVVVAAPQQCFVRVCHLSCDSGIGGIGITSKKMQVSGSSTNGLLPISAAPPNQQDMEAGKEVEEDSFDDSTDPFDIAYTKNAPPETLQRWRQAALVLTASRRFRYTLDLKKEEEKEKRRRMIRSHAQVIRIRLPYFSDLLENGKLVYRCHHYNYLHIFIFLFVGFWYSSLDLETGQVLWQIQFSNINGKS